MVSSWCTHRIHLEAYFDGNKITDSAKRRALLVSSLSDNIVRRLQDRFSTLSVNSQTYEQIVENLEEQHNPEGNETPATFFFFIRKQLDSENVGEYILDLRRLAKNCNFGDSLDRILRDRILCGIRDDDARCCILTHKKLTVKEEEEFVIASEKALNDVQDMCEGLPETTTSSTNVLRLQRRWQHWTQWGNNEAGWQACYQCGGPHATCTSRHFNAGCYHWGIKGHLAKLCRQRHSCETGEYAVESAEAESEEEMLLALLAHSSGTGATFKPREENLTRHGGTLQMIIDTGSPGASSQ
ncbi:uncharacterized protein LOC142765843 [Rhipicephalus microplus]|uniref:uncharacterized protein LOC142765843 n=1 Tax=Rhipicephalus microplus TaxID=6941 RepID=UPI003F6B9984